MSSFTFTETVRIAHAGVGRGADLLRAFAALPQVEVVALADGDEQALAAAARLAPAAATHHRFAEVLARDDVDAVVVTTAPERRAAHAEAALLAGRHALVASPLAPTPEAVRRLTALAAARDRRLMAGHLLRYHPAVTAAEALIARGALGTLRTVRAERTGDAVWALVAEDLAVALALAGPPRSVAAWTRDDDDDLLLVVGCGGGARLALAASRVEVRAAQRLHVGGTLGTAVVDRLRPDAPLWVWRAADAPPPPPDGRAADRSAPYVAPADPADRLARAFVDAVQERRAPHTAGADDLAVVRVLEAARRALESGGTPIVLDDAPDAPDASPESGDAA